MSIPLAIQVGIGSQARIRASPSSTAPPGCGCSARRTVINHSPFTALGGGNREPCCRSLKLQVHLRESEVSAFRFTDFCAPLFFGGCDPSIILENLCAFAQIRGWNWFEIRGRPNLLPPQPSLTFHGHLLDLRGGADALFANFSRRSGVRSARPSKAT